MFVCGEGNGMVAIHSKKKMCTVSRGARGLDGGASNRLRKIEDQSG